VRAIPRREWQAPGDPHGRFSRGAARAGERERNQRRRRSRGPDSLFVAYYASAEIGCHLALGWPVPERVLDLFTEFRNLTNGIPPANGSGLLGALSHYGLDSIGAVEKDAMRELVLRGGPWTDAERTAILDYCESDVAALARLLLKRFPTDLNRWDSQEITDGGVFGH
jgi:hypothetical protein